MFLELSDRRMVTLICGLLVASVFSLRRVVTGSYTYFSMLGLDYIFLMELAWMMG